MTKGENNIHRNGADIIQRFIATSMIGERPLIALSIDTAKVKEILSTDLPGIETKDEQADTFYLLEDGTYLHVEYQTTSKKDDVLRFAGYVMRLYNKLKHKEPIIKSVVVYAPHISPENVTDTLDIGVLRYQFQPVFLREVNLEERYQEVLDRIRKDPTTRLSEEDKMVIIYKPLANSDLKEVENDSLRVVNDLQVLESELERAKLGSSIFVLMKKYLSEQGEKLILEALYKMDIVKEWYEEKQKDNYRDVLKKLFKTGASPEAIELMVERTHYTQEEVEEIRKEAESE